MTAGNLRCIHEALMAISLLRIAMSVSCAVGQNKIVYNCAFDAEMLGGDGSAAGLRPVSVCLTSLE